jgi:hypothetical protein
MSKGPFTAEDIQGQLKSFRMFFNAAIILFLASMLVLLGGIAMLDHWQFFERLQPEFFSWLAREIPFLSVVLLALGLAALVILGIVYFKLDRISRDDKAMMDGLITSAILEEYEKSNFVLRFWLELIFRDLWEEL